MSYLEVIKYLESFVNYEKKTEFLYKESLKLERIEGILRIIGDPQNAFKSIHVAGTKGKGSVCAFTAYILREAGYKVGLFTSPHLSDVRERIRILHPRFGKIPASQEDFEGMIPKKDLAELVTRLKNKIDKYCSVSRYGPLSFFEVYTALAFQYFKEQKIDFAVLETGMGGRLDATNVVDPEICGITSISFDHTNKLGNTLIEIAGEKAGIIKSRKPQVHPSGEAEGGQVGHRLMVVSAPQEEDVLELLLEKCNREQAGLFVIGSDIKLELTSSGLDHQEFNIRGNLGKFSGLRINFLGAHQLINAALAVSLVSGISLLSRENIEIGVLRKGLLNTRWPGRFERVLRDPLIILDGAHNVASARALADTLKKNYPREKVILVLGISRDKDVAGIARELFAIADRIILTEADNPRAVFPADILAAGKDFLQDKKAVLTRNVLEALKLVRNSASRGSLVLVTGSMFVVGEARGIIKNIPPARAV